MRGVSFLTDETNEKIAVQIDLKKNKKLWEDFCDYTQASKRKVESTKDWSTIKSKLKKKILI